MKHIEQYTRQGKPVTAHIRNGLHVVHETHGEGQVLKADLESGDRMVWFYNRQRGLIHVGKSAITIK